MISSIAQERGYLPTSKEVRELLKKHGTPMWLADPLGKYLARYAFGVVKASTVAKLTA